MTCAPINVGSRKQLFIDHRFIDAGEGISLGMNAPRKTGEPLIVGDRPWENYFVTAISVLRDDDGVFKMWYGAADQSLRRWDGSQFCHLCYATSGDGVHWEKPGLDLVSFQGAKKNNIVFRANDTGMTGCVFKDPSGPREERYKLIYGDRRFPWKAPAPYGIYGTTCGAVSPDGIQWTPLTGNPIMPWYNDTLYAAFWDDRINRYVAYLRDDDWPESHLDRFRRIARSETEDFRRWPAPAMVLACDDEDPPKADLYNAAAIKYPYAEDAYFAFPSLFDHVRDVTEVQLAVSRDGLDWRRAGGRKPFIPLGAEGAFDHFQIYAGAGITRAGDELSIYYVSHDTGHDATLGKEFGTVFSRASLRLDGFISADADSRGGTLTTPSFVFAGDHLELNADTGADGYVQVEMLGADGHSIKEFSVKDGGMVRGNGVRERVNWKNDVDLSRLGGKPTRLRFTMRDAKLYAFQFTR